MTEQVREVVVIGAGITGLVAAWELTGGVTGPSSSTPRVTIIDAASTTGGKISSLPYGDRLLDAGPDGALVRRPELLELCQELGIESELRPIAASGATVFARKKLRNLPDDLALGVPTRFSSLRRSGVLSRRGLLRAWRDVVAPVPPSRGPLGDRTIGSLVGTKLGNEVVTTLIDPMIGGINAGRVADMSAAAIFPPLLEAAQQRGSLMKAMRPFAPPPSKNGEESPPAFMAPEGGMHRLIAHLTTALQLRGVRFVLSSPVTGLVRQGGDAPSWAVNTATTTTLADGVVLCTPAPVASTLLAPFEAEAASLLEQIDYASVAIATFTFREDDLALPAKGTGVLVPPGSHLPNGDRSGQRFFTTALTFLDRKWPHLKREGETTLRVHCGRIDDPRPSELDDHQLMELLVEELGQLVTVQARPTQRVLQRWENALPQYRVNHLLRVGGIESAVARQPQLQIAGAALHGVGVPACIASGRAAGRRALEAVQSAR